jgi:DNA-binding NtrC family response regulator
VAPIIKKASDFTLLIAEDSAGSRAMYEKVFKREGYGVATCDNAAQAMAELKEAKYDLLITDLEMPKSNTFELFPFLRDEFPKLPVLIVSGHYKDLQEDFRNKGFNISGFLNKPVQVSVLSKKVAEILGVSQTPDADPRRR